MFTVTYKDRSRSYDGEIEKLEDTKLNYRGETLVGFHAPNIYASKDWVCHLQGEPLNDLIRAQKQLLEAGCSVVIVDAYRDYQSQKEAHEKDPSMVAKPDVSMHPRGLALDLRMIDSDVGTFDSDDEDTYGDQDYLADVMAEYNWVRTVLPKEVWHFDWRG